MIAIGVAGAYGAGMASNYNSRPLVAEAMVDAKRHALVRPRQDLAELVAHDRLAPWLAPATASRRTPIGPPAKPRVKK